MLRKHIAILTFVLVALSVNSNTIASESSNVLPAIYLLLLADEVPGGDVLPELQNLSSNIELFENIASSNVRFTNSGGTELSLCTASPPLPAGLVVAVSSNGRTCEISGTPISTQSATSYTITATNATGSSSATVSLSVATLSVSGQIMFERVPTKSGAGLGLAFADSTFAPVRLASVELVNANNVVVATTRTDASGFYQFSPSSNQSVRVRVRAELLQTGTASYNVRVVDNTSGKAIYALTEATTRTPSSASERNLNANSGRGPTSYTSTRAAAPFAILDSIYESIADIIVADSTVQMSPLVVNWSINNVPAGNFTPSDLAIGRIGTSFYSNNELYILGAENSDTDEFDDHVIIHEWGHYFEDNVARSDSIGGAHGSGDLLDKRVAFGEGFGNALSAIITDDPLYIDTFGNQQASGFQLDMEGEFNSAPGWYSEQSVQEILYDLYDADNDAADQDTLTLGLGPIYQVLVNQQRSTASFTSIFSFITALKSDNPANSAAIDSMTLAQGVNGDDEFGTNEVNAAGLTNDVLPIYSSLIFGQTLNVCTITPDNASPVSNRLSNTRFIKIDIANAGSYQIVVNRTSASSGYGISDPDFRVILDGNIVINAISELANSETSVPTDFAVDTYSMALTDFSIQFPGARGQACFDVSLVAN